MERERIMKLTKEGIDTIILNADHTLGIVKKEYLIFDEKYTIIEWDKFFDIWSLWRLKKKKESKVKYALNYILDAKKILDGLGFDITKCKFYWSKINQPLIIEFDKYAILLAPRVNENEDIEAK